jgi:hypothetical protein
MSLHTLANHLQSAGRGEDKMLVHMTPGEVKGLQSLALAHGGSLTINPETGLPEAGFLRSLLPMIAGFALGPAGFGLFQTAMGAGLAVGAATGLATGSLKEGLMAGLGAYGGAGMGQGLMAQGAKGAAGAGAGINPAAAGQVGLQTGTSNAANVFANTADDVALANYRTLGANAGGAGSGVGLNTGLTNQGLQLNAMGAPTATSGLTPSVTNASAYSPTNTGVPSYAKPPALQTGTPPRVIELTDTPIREYVAPGLDPKAVDFSKVGSYRVENGRIVDAMNRSGFPYNPTAPSAASGYVPSTATTSQPFAGGLQGTTVPSGAVQTPPSAFSERMSQLGRGAKESFSSVEGLKGLYNAMPEYSVLASGATLASAMQPEYKKPKKDKSFIRPYDFEYNPTNVALEPYSGSGERLYFNPTFTARTPYEAPGPEYAAAGGLMGYAAGGQVEQMSAMNSVGANTGYPMASIDTPMYANPMRQRPEATNVLAPSADAGVGTYTGEARFAIGGPTTKQGSGSISMFGKGRFTAKPENSGYSYSYDPSTMQFAQLGSPSNNQPSRGLIARAMGFGPKKANEFEMMGQTQKASTDGTVTGGMAQPIMQPQSPAQPLIPNVNIPAYQTPEQQLGLGGFYNTMNQQLGSMGAYSGYAAGGNVGGGISHLGGYSDGGRLLKGPGDGVSDSIPASIGNRQPARLADGEFVVPARIVSEIGNGSTEAGARKLYAMMDRVQRARRKTVGKGQVAKNTKAEKLLPA